MCITEFKILKAFKKTKLQKITNNVCDVLRIKKQKSPNIHSKRSSNVRDQKVEYQRKHLRSTRHQHTTSLSSTASHPDAGTSY
jgi:hypothetical protein